MGNNPLPATASAACPFCQGTGVILSESYGFAGLSQYDCPDCEGLGYFADEVEEDSLESLLEPTKPVSHREVSDLIHAGVRSILGVK